MLDASTITFHMAEAFEILLEGFLFQSSIDRGNTYFLYTTIVQRFSVEISLQLDCADRDMTKEGRSFNP